MGNQKSDWDGTHVMCDACITHVISVHKAYRIVIVLATCTPLLCHMTQLFYSPALPCFGPALIMHSQHLILLFADSSRPCSPLGCGGAFSSSSGDDVGAIARRFSEVCHAAVRGCTDVRRGRVGVHEPADLSAQ